MGQHPKRKQVFLRKRGVISTSMVFQQITNPKWHDFLLVKFDQKKYFPGPCAESFWHFPRLRGWWFTFKKNPVKMTLDPKIAGFVTPTTLVEMPKKNLWWFTFRSGFLREKDFFLTRLCTFVPIPPATKHAEIPILRVFFSHPSESGWDVPIWKGSTLFGVIFICPFLMVIFFGRVCFLMFESQQKLRIGKGLIGNFLLCSLC